MGEAALGYPKDLNAVGNNASYRTRNLSTVSFCTAIARTSSPPEASRSETTDQAAVLLSPHQANVVAKPPAGVPGHLLFAVLKNVAVLIVVSFSATMAARLNVGK
jgi:hypothetical protein